MPQRKCAVKALRQNLKSQARNLSIKNELKKTIKDFLKSIGAKNKTEAQAKLKVVFKKFDKAAKRNIVSPNTAARRKARFSRLITSLT